MNVKLAGYREFDSIVEMLDDVKRREGKDAFYEMIELRKSAGLCESCTEPATHSIPRPGNPTGDGAVCSDHYEEIYNC